MGSSPIFQWRLPDLTTSPPDVPKAMTDLATDIEATVVATVGKAGAFCLATGTWSSGVAGANTVNLTTISASGGASWALSGGTITAPYTGVWLASYWAGMSGGPGASHVWIGPSSGYSDNLNAGATMSSRAANVISVAKVDAGTAWAKPLIYTAPSAGSSGTARLYVALLGNPT